MYGNYGKGQLHDEHFGIKRDEPLLADFYYEPVTQKGNLQKVQSKAIEVSSSVRGDDLRRVQDQLARLEVAVKWAAVIVIGVLAIGYMAPK